MKRRRSILYRLVEALRQAAPPRPEPPIVLEDWSAQDPAWQRAALTQLVADFGQGARHGA